MYKTIGFFIMLAILSLKVAAQENKGKENITDLGITDKVVKDQLNDILSSYLELKNALVASNYKKSNEKAGDLLGKIKLVDISKLSGNQKSFFEANVGILESSASVIERLTDIDKQREVFSSLSDNLYAIVKEFKINKAPVYLSYCPMALDNKGAYWLSEKKEIANPYFGRSMLTCGKVTQTL